MAVNINDGILPYLKATAAQHNGHDDKEFVGYMKKLGMPQDGFTRVTISGLGRLYDVHRHTMQDWVARYNREHAEDHDRSAV